MITLSKANKFTHKSIPVPRNNEKWLIRVLVFVGLVSSGYFGLWFFKEDHIGNDEIFVLLSITLSYKFLHIFYEWFYIISISVSPRPVLKKDWSVDMLTTFVPGEPYDMIVETLQAMVAVKYPHRTFLCDEGNDPYLKQVCKELGVVHVYRGKDKTGAKAGNINYALKHFATGEITIILDPDHVPVPEFIDRVLPYFEDPKIGFVQSIQGYSNQNESWVARGAAEQTYMFYGPLMMGMNTHGTVQAIGANCAFRRAALDSIGGHAAGLCEDMHTSMRLHAKKWTSVYLPELLARGRAPSDLGAYYQQQLKWSRGSFELLFEVLPRIFFKLTWKQQLHYFLTPLYFLYGVIGLLDLFIPVYCLFTFEVPLLFNFVEFIWKTSPVLISVVLIRLYVQRFTLDKHESGLHFMGGILRVGTWWVYLVGFVFSLFRRKVSYKPTPKQKSSEKNRLIVLPNLVVIGISIVAIIFGLSQDNTLYNWIMATFAIVNVVILSLVVLIGFQHLEFKTYLKWAVGKLSGFNVRLHKFSHLFIYPFFKNNLIVSNLSIILLLTVLFHPLDIWFDNSEIVKAPDKKSGWVIAGGSDHTIKERWLLINDNRGKLLTGLKEKTLLQGSIMDPDTAALKRFEKILFYSGRSHKIPLFTVERELLSDTVFNRDSLFWKNMADKVRYYDNPVIFQLSSSVLPKLDSAVHQKEKVLFRKLVTYLRNTGASNAVFGWTFNNSAFYPGDHYMDLIIAAPEDLKENSEFFPSRHTVLLSIPDPADLDGLKMDQHFWNDYGSQLIGWFTPREADPGIGESQRPVRLILNDSLGFDQHPEDPVGAPLRSKAVYFDDAAKKFVWKHADSALYIKGVVYNPESHRNDTHWPLTRRQLDHDFAQIKEMGANTISRSGIREYDRNIFRAAQKQGLAVIYSLDIDPRIDFLSQPDEVEKLKNKILREVEEFRDQSPLIAWSVNDGGWMKLSGYFDQPYLTVVRMAYARFLEELLLEIKQLDGDRPIIFSFAGGPNLAGAFGDLQPCLPLIDIIGINTANTARVSQIKTLIADNDIDLPYLVTEFGVKPTLDWDEELLTEDNRILEPSSYEKARTYSKLWQMIEEDRTNGFGGLAYCWKDRLSGTASLSGITDYKGRLKPAYYTIKQHYTGVKQSFPMADLVLKEHAYYRAVQTQFIDSRKNPLTYEWQVKKKDFLNTSFSMSFHNQKRHLISYFPVRYLYNKLNRPFHPSGRGDGLEIRKKEYEDERIYLYIYNEQGQVVTASYPIINADE